MQSLASLNADTHAYYERTFTVINPGLTTPLPPTAGFITCRDMKPARLYCEKRHTVDEKGLEFQDPAIIFEMKGSLKPELPDFYLTTRSDQDGPSFESDGSVPHRMQASCWLGYPAERGLENTVWRQGLRRLQAIGRDSGCITSQVVRPEPDKGPVTTDLDMLQIYWTPSDVVQAVVKGSCKNPMSYMPVYDTEENRCPFWTLGEVPFGSRVRVRFTLQSGRPEGLDESKPEIMTARLLSMHIL